MRNDYNNLILFFNNGGLMIRPRYNWSASGSRRITVIHRNEIRKYFPDPNLPESEQLALFNDDSKGYKIMCEKMIQEIHKLSCEKMLPISIGGLLFDKFKRFGVSLNGRVEKSKFSTYWA